jgi:hypothetical protein
VVVVVIVEYMRTRENRLVRVPRLILNQSPKGKDQDNEACFWYACMVCICTCMQASRHVD